jgi:hypothetical protein
VNTPAVLRSASVLFFASALASAGGSSPEAWGTTANTVVAIHASSFQLATTSPASTEGAIGNAGVRSCATGECFWAHALQLPTGALITGAELSACDGDAAAEVQFGVIVQQKPAIDFVDLVVGGSGGAATPGCQNFPVSATVPPVVNNNTGAYIVVVGASPGTNLGFLSVRVMYRLQVSLAPGVATFADVPTSHPFFRFIEALAASGITGGCTPAPSPNFCPDQPLTRGQMAVFLSAALGLHFSN